MKYASASAFIGLFFSFSLSAQTSLLSENFDQCGLPAGWQVSINGYQSAVWSVGLPTNTNSDSTSIDGSCMVLIDDDITGENTPAFLWEMRSPVFDASGFTDVRFGVDVHFRDYNEADESFSIWVSDGQNEKMLLNLADDQSTGQQFSEFKHFEFDLAFGYAKENVQLLFRYDDGNGGWGWWAGFDNVEVTASGQGELIVLEDFDDCEKPADWATEILSGDDDWQFSPIVNGNYQGVNTMNGTCFAFFDDDILWDTAAYSTVRLISPWFDGAKYAEYALDFDFIQRYWSENTSVIVETGDGEEHFVQNWATDVGGPLWDAFEKIRLDLSPFRHQQMRVIFQYSDGNQWAWWAGLDNVKITGSGIANDLCSQAAPLQTDAPCAAASNRNAIFEGPDAPCAQASEAGLWFTWTADFTGWAMLETRADFNDVVTIFTGDCTNPTLLTCDNRDEHGFLGEATYFQAISGTAYFFRVSGQKGGFGLTRGEMCVRVAPVSGPPVQAANQNCLSAQSVSIGQTCDPSDNKSADFLAPLPSPDLLARADVWFSFVAPTLLPNQKLHIRSSADFSDVLTVYAGTCSDLEEVVSSPYGQELDVENVIGGQSYFLQVAGIFATTEGHFCPEIMILQENAPNNDICQEAQPIQLGADCVPQGSNGAGFSGLTPPCALAVGSDVWFSFVAPPSGSVQLRIAAGFEQVAAVWSGSCNDLELVACLENLLFCQGYHTVGDLVPGESYFLQIAATAEATTFDQGGICIKILDGSAQADYLPLYLEVNTTCTGVGTALMEATVFGGAAPIQWSGVPSGTVLATGTQYLVNATDAEGCVLSFTGVVGECLSADCYISPNFEREQPSCHDAADGSVLVSPVGGAAPYTVQWSNGAQGLALLGLAQGVYFLTITDTNDCEYIGSVSLQAPAPLTASVVSFTQPNVGQNNGDIVVESQGGTAPYTYSWSLNGQFFSDEKDLFGIGVGLYALEISDANGCLGLLQFNLNTSAAAAPTQNGIFAAISPNPATDLTFLELRLPTAQDVRLSLLDAQGKTLQEWQPIFHAGGRLPVSLKGLPAGLYALHIETEGRRLVRKVVVE